jgi:CobQ-like glutamine amidotransferase family enzyme
VADRVLRVCALYPDLMNIYADRGNITVLERRCAWRGIGFELAGATVGDDIDPDAHDLFYIGGGQDRDQALCARDLADRKREALHAAAGRGAVVFAVCGGYQLLGHEYVPEVGPAIPGLGILDVTTRAGKVRFVGNLLAVTDDGKTLIGFENHSGYTYLGPDAEPLGEVIAGHGNNGQDKTEGAVQGKLIGCYLHGSALPKNPWLADQLISWGLARRQGDIELVPLDDAEEHAAELQAAEVAKTRT